MFKLRIIGFIAQLVEHLINIPFFLLDLFLSKEEKIKRMIRRTELKELSKVRIGEYVKVQGVATPYERTMTSPLQKKKCVGFQVIVGREMVDGYDDSYIKEERMQNFYLTDGDQKILIVPNKAIIDLGKEDVGSSGLLKNADQNMKEFLKRHQTGSKSFGFNKSMNFMEGVLKEGEEVTIVGKVSTYRSRGRKGQIAIRHFDKYPLYLKTE